MLPHDERDARPPRVVLHVDLDAFFVQVERKLNPTLIGKPMAVQQHADIIAVSYEARALGVKKHMPVSSIRREHPTVKLVHVETIGLQNDKVSYRSYRAAARAIFTLVRAFCPSEGRGDGNDDHGASEKWALPKSNSEKAQNGSVGMFQKASIDEAYLEPTRRTLLAELRHSSNREKTGPSAAAGSSTSITKAAVAISSEPSLAGAKRNRSGGSIRSGGSRGSHGCSSALVEPTAQPWRDGDDSRGKGPTQSQDEDDSGEGNRWNLWAECSPDDDGRPNEGARRRSSRAKKDEEEEEARLLEAGGLLATRIQQTLSDVLHYDCSIGVASNKFLAKLVTNLAKPKGVRVLLRRDTASLLASTPATKIPGCGAGSVAAKQFVGLGVGSILDLQRVQAAELRQRLGEQLGVKVHDRCRGIDHDPVEADPIPSRVSSQLSLVPLISPAHCLGKPGEKLTPVFPWEVERVKPFLVTLVDDLIDRAKEELAERSRRPTKLCIEHHLHQRGSKSQTFVLPAQTPSRPRHSTASAVGIPSDGVAAERQSHAVDTPEFDAQGKSEDAPVVPAATLLVELALTPFKKYRQSRRSAEGDGLHGGAATRAGAGAAGAGEMSHQGEALPPVVKLIVSLLAFETMGLAPPTPAPPGQRTLRDMMWLKKSAPLSAAALTKAPGGEASPPLSGSKVSGEAAVATAGSAPEAVAPSPVARVSPAENPGRIVDHAAGKPHAGEQTGGSRSRVPRKVEEPGSILVRCPRCKACLPVGEAWDAHREEHTLIEAPNDHQEPGGIRKSRPGTLYHLGGSSSRPRPSAMPPRHQPWSSPELVGAAAGTRSTSGTVNMGRSRGDFVGDGDDIPPPDAEVRTPIQGAAGGNSDGGAGRRHSWKLSHLLMIAVTPEQAADVLGDRGFLRDDGQTRFANLGLVGNNYPREEEEEVALKE